MMVKQYNMSREVFIVGRDASADKLIVVDSWEFSGDNGVEI